MLTFNQIKKFFFVRFSLKLKKLFNYNCLITTDILTIIYLSHNKREVIVYILIFQVLNEGYLLVRIESYDDDPNFPGSDWFCYHSTSASILPPGFCEIHNLELTPPSGYSHFSWTDYLARTDSHPAPAELFDLVCLFP